ncbi:hypothetical protein Mal4_01720 [Maioricimonas rarisocia]|uniref:Uncharacterized protein n=1 Tax=Maioricimonas rarisocia TaxID=2528026 RepID=A0A517Z079_9PLAN|nr:hypothetical protein [Maioricimonas rarisocia]QDU35890.1 hypothetical protein Mal4_01720 [Maioricimonas rarisocia]
MKAFLIIVLVVVVAVLLGWVTFSSSDSDATIRVDKQEIQQDTGEAVRHVEEFADDVTDPIDRSIHEPDEPVRVDD